MDYIKLAAVLVVFAVLAPAAGFLLKGRPTGQRWAFAALCFMTLNGLLGPGNWGLTVLSIEWYRGHTKGYHFYYNHAIAIALIVARLLEAPRSFRWLPPGLAGYLVWCFLATLSVMNAPEPGYVWMTLHKQVFIVVIFLATFNLLRTEADLQFLLRVMAWMMLWQMIVCLKLKYGDGMYLVRGTFEHQNPLAMYSVLIGMPLLATAMGPLFRQGRWVLFGYLACAVVVQCTLSRAGLAMFALGTVAVMGASVLERPTARRLTTVAVLGMVGVVGLVLTLDTVLARFQDRGNEASGELRHVMNHASREMARDHALGLGWNNYALAVNPPYRYADIYHDWIRGRGMRVNPDMPNAVVESHYYLLLAENGYPGLAGWLAVIGLALWRNARAFWAFDHSFLRCLSLGIAVGCGSNYVQSTLERVLTQPRNLMLWMILFAVTARIEVMRREAGKQRAAAIRQPGSPPG